MDVSSGPNAADAPRWIQPEGLCCGKPKARATSSPGFPQETPGTYTSATECHVDQRNAMKSPSDSDSPFVPGSLSASTWTAAGKPGANSRLSRIAASLAGSQHGVSRSMGKYNTTPRGNPWQVTLMRPARSRAAGWTSAAVPPMEKAIRLADGPHSNGQSLAPLKCPFTGWIGTCAFRPGQRPSEGDALIDRNFCRNDPSAGGLCVAGIHLSAIDVPFAILQKNMKLIRADQQ
jgi:hypothetical protein